MNRTTDINMPLKNNLFHKSAIAIHSASIGLTIALYITVLSFGGAPSGSFIESLVLIGWFFVAVWFSFGGLLIATLSMKKNIAEPNKPMGLKNIWVQSFTIPSSLFACLINLACIWVIFFEDSIGSSSMMFVGWSLGNNVLAISILPLSAMVCLLIWNHRK